MQEQTWGKEEVNSKRWDTGIALRRGAKDTDQSVQEEKAKN